MSILLGIVGIHKGTEGNVATMKKVVVSSCLGEEEWDVEAVATVEDDGAYFVEDDRERYSIN